MFPDCLAPTIGDGSFSGDTTYDGSASVTCDAGYDGSGPAVCGSDGSWQVLPTCIAKGKYFNIFVSCSIRQCIDLVARKSFMNCMQPKFL